MSFFLDTVDQWRNMRGGGQGGRVPPETFQREILGDLSGKIRQGKKVKKWEILRKMRKNGKTKDGN